MKDFLYYLPCLITAIILLVVLIYIILQYKTAFSIPFDELKVTSKMIFFFLIGGYLLTFCEYALDIFEDTWSKYAYIIIGYGPHAFYFSALIAFVDYLTTYYFRNFDLMAKSSFRAFKLIIYIFYIVFWISSICILSGIFYNEAFGGMYWYTTYYCYVSVLNIAIVIYIIYLIILIRHSLKKFPITLKDKKKLLILVITFSSITILLNIMNAALYLTGTLGKIQNSKSYCYDSVYYCLVIILANVVPQLTYVLYLKKDSEHVSMIKQTMTEYDNESSIIGPASAIEEALIRVLIDS